ncbi:MAG TPA: DUF4097 family beta strand repeat-containing protein [Bacteroidales bacterium]|nr:DUF4097 family beta strand repeat-containing protein [Bacteroidales bacterium]
MKSLIYIIILSLTAACLNAQMKIDKHLDFSGKSKVTLDIQISDSIRIVTWNKNEVYVTASVNVNENKDNDAYKTEFIDNGNNLVVKTHLDENYFKGRKNNCCNETEIFWVAYLPERAALSVESINADITITGKTGPMNVKSISGFIDLTVPESRSASVDFSTISGTIYSNHLLTSLDTHNGVPSRVKYNLNNGGEAIKLETISGDIFFRK